jgi:serine/threonine protein kinase
MEGALSGRTLGGGAYRVGRVLGQGAMGAVYEGVQEALGRAVAIKVLHASQGRLRQDQFERFQREAKAAAALGHANIVQITDFQWLAGEPPFLVMERLVGQSLGAAMVRGGKLSPHRVSFIAAQVLSALEAAHRAGIVHRDIKPDNVFLTLMAMVNDIVKVLDFGVAKLLDEAPLTMIGAMVGSPAYMAPEQAFGRAVDGRSDVYAVGATMYHALSGRLPIDATDPGDFLSKVELPKASLGSILPGFDPALSAVVARAMERRPEDRFPSADAMRQALMPWAKPRSQSVADLSAQVPMRASTVPTALPSHPPPPSSRSSVAPAAFSRVSQAPLGFSGASQVPPGFSGASQVPQPPQSGALANPGFAIVTPPRTGGSNTGVFLATAIGGGVVVFVVVCVAAAAIFVSRKPPLAGPVASVSSPLPLAPTTDPDPPLSSPIEPPASVARVARPISSAKDAGVEVVADAGSGRAVSATAKSATCATVKGGPGTPVFHTEEGVRSFNGAIARDCLFYASACTLGRPSVGRSYRIRLHATSRQFVGMDSLDPIPCMAFDECMVRTARFTGGFVHASEPTFTLACTIVR